MNRRRVPGTELYVSPICLGTMTFGTPVREKEAIELVNYAVDCGINFIDTANMYEGYTRTLGSSGGIAEEILGKALKYKRNDVIIATKVGMKVGSEPEDEFTSPKAIKKHLDKSLKRLKTDFIDIYYLHKYDPVTPPLEILHALNEAITDGKIRYIAVSNYSAAELESLLRVSKKNNLPMPVMCQPPLSILKQDALFDIVPLCVENKIGVVPYQVLQGGLLTGKYKRGQSIPENSRKAEKDGWVWQLTDELFDKLEEIQSESDKEELTMTQYAIQWSLRQSGVVSAIIGVKNTTQVDEAVRAVINTAVRN